MVELFSRPPESISETRLRVKYVMSDKMAVVGEEVSLPPPPANETAEQERARMQREVALLQARNKALANDMNLMMKKGGKSIVKGFTLLHILLTAILAFVLGRYL
jgi:predicted component of type VI protein secretion system